MIIPASRKFSKSHLTKKTSVWKTLDTNLRSWGSLFPQSLATSQLYTIDRAAKQLYRARRDKEIIFDLVALRDNASCIKYVRSLVEGINRRNKFGSVESSGNLVIISAHDSGNFSHLHLLHECSYIESRCRCFVSRLDNLYWDKR